MQINPQQNQEGLQKMQKQDADALRKKTLIVKIIVACLALGCVILAIFILAKSSQFFGYMFTLDTEIKIKAYLRKNYTILMALLYLSIFGFVIVIADTILLFVKFTQKEKLLWFHLAYYIGFLICGCMTLSKKDYKDYMGALNGRLITDPACLAASFLLECYLAPQYLSFDKTVTIFFIVFNILFVGYAALYHYAAAILIPFETEATKPELVKTTIFNANGNNQTFVSEMMDEYA